ncbi:hypothetical protein EJ03DRAFT_356750 [Teratosphaeria nubilosa]|uniref:Uncharacterized protein n=1 Tax=Teratosphaeria nubilosa TaxID=161662 RepID=A0A6G1LQA2_9PEZI|nr:hypothetical protein EJ03DRAFT_356750 [Teratosphaeria nubilosa]
MAGKALSLLTGLSARTKPSLISMIGHLDAKRQNTVGFMLGYPVLHARVKRLADAAVGHGPPGTTGGDRIGNVNFKHITQALARECSLQTATTTTRSHLTRAN